MIDSSKLLDALKELTAGIQKAQDLHHADKITAADFAQSQIDDLTAFTGAVVEYAVQMEGRVLALERANAKQ